MDIQRSRDQNVQRGRPLFHFSFFLSSPPPPPPPSGPCFTRVTASSRGFPRVQKQPSYYYRVRTDCSRVIRVAVCLLRHVASLSSLMKHRKAALFLKARPFANPRIFIPLLVDHILPIIIPIPFFLNSCNTEISIISRGILKVCVTIERNFLNMKWRDNIRANLSTRGLTEIGRMNIRTGRAIF